jgi:hypothetical protein
MVSLCSAGKMIYGRICNGLRSWECVFLFMDKTKSSENVPA